jgi:hypothetical protein
VTYLTESQIEQYAENLIANLKSGAREDAQQCCLEILNGLYGLAAGEAARLRAAMRDALQDSK